MATTITYDYSREADVLARMLRPGSLPMGDSFNWEQPQDDELAYLGEAEVACSGDARIARLTRMKWLQKRIRYVARSEDIYTDWNDSVELDGDELGVAVEYPLDKMSRYEQARYRLRVLLINSQGVLDGEAHEWALQTSRDQCAKYWDKKEAKRGKWDAGMCPEVSRILSLFIADVHSMGINFSYWTLGTYREKNHQLDGWRERWGLPAMEWQPADDELVQDGTHRHLSAERRVEIYTKVRDLIKRELPRARVSLCKETHDVRKAVALCNADCNCLL